MEYKLTARDIKIRLADKHIEDFFICEVKTGATFYNSDLHIIDAWVMKKSWTKPLITAYEIKVRRSDFIKDNKWHFYLDYCHSFYFICPRGIIKPEEIGKEAGLMYVYPDSKYIKTIKKAPYRKVNFSQDLFTYILMNKLESDRYPFHDSKQDYIRDFLEHQRIDSELGRKLESKLADKLIDLNGIVERYKNDSETLKELKTLMQKYNLDTWNIVEQIEKLLTGGLKIYNKNSIIYSIKSCLNDLKKLKEDLEKDV